jgi:hypothetical protein
MTYSQKVSKVSGLVSGILRGIAIPLFFLVWVRVLRRRSGLKKSRPEWALVVCL